MSTATKIVDALLGDDPAEFMRDLHNKWKAHSRKDAKGWYHTKWTRGLETIEDETLCQDEERIKRLERFSNWLEQVFPYPEGIGQTLIQWHDRAIKRGYWATYEDEVEPNIKNIKESEVEPAEFMNSFGKSWVIDWEPMRGAHAPDWVRMRLSRGLDVEGYHSVTKVAAGWWSRFVPWLDARLPYADAAMINPHIGPGQWINQGLGKGFREKYEAETGDKFPHAYAGPIVRGQ